MKLTPDDNPSLDTTALLPGGWESQIVESTTPGLNVMTVHVGDYQISSTFTDEQVEGDQAVIEIQIAPDEESVEVAYDIDTQTFSTDTLG